MARGILVTLDGSTLATRAVAYAELLAQHCHAELVRSRVMAPEAPVVGSRAIARAEHGLTTLRHGSPADALADLAADQEVALIVMATHGQSGPSRWALGDIAEQLLRRAHAPVLLLTPSALDAGGPERLLRRVVVPVDGSELSRQVFPVVRELARRLGDPVTLVRALDAPTIADVGPLERATPAERAHVLDDIHARLFAGLHRRAGEWREEGLDVDATVQRGPAADVIRQVAKSRQAGWLAMASHGRGGLGGLALGSVALAVLQRTTLPVLLAAVPKPARYRIGANE